MADALKQYLDLYKEHLNLIECNSCELMNSMRPEAYKVLEAKGLPQKGSENYEISDLDGMLSPDFGLNLQRIEIDANPRLSFHCGVPAMSAAVFFQINDIFQKEESKPAVLPKGVSVRSLKEFCSIYPEKAKKYYGKIADIGNPIVALDTLLAQDGIVVHVEKGTYVDIPVQLVNILHHGMPLMAVRRLLIILEDDAEIKILSCDHTQVEETDFMALQTIEIYVGANSRLDYYDLEESSAHTGRLSALYLHQERDSEVVIEGITLYNGTTRNEYYCKFKGEHSRLKLSGLGIEDCSRLLDTYSRIEHCTGYCESDELFKYVVDNEARGAFEGLIMVAEKAEKTEAYQSNRNILGSDTARMFSKPQLEIYNDDVKCSHGCAVGQLDSKQVFYMQTRGLPEAEAKFLLKQAFMADVLDRVSLPALRDRLHTLVEKRFSGESLNCSSCRSACFDSPENMLK